MQRLLPRLHALQAPEQGVLRVLCYLQLAGLWSYVVCVAVQEVQACYLSILLHLHIHICKHLAGFFILMRRLQRVCKQQLQWSSRTV